MPLGLSGSEPIIVQHIKNVHYPVSRDELVAHVRRSAADGVIASLMEMLPRRSYDSPGEVMQALVTRAEQSYRATHDLDPEQFLLADDEEDDDDGDEDEDRDDDDDDEDDDEEEDDDEDDEDDEDGDEDDYGSEDAGADEED